jgi:hypothetical protein
MNWEDLVVLIENNIQNAKYRHLAPSSWETCGYDKYFLDLFVGNKYFEIRFDPHQIRYYTNQIGWIWIEAFELRKGVILTRRRRLAFVRPSYHSEDGAIIIPKDFAIRINDAVRTHFMKRESEKLASISI